MRQLFSIPWEWLIEASSHLSTLRGLLAITTIATSMWVADQCGVTDLINGWATDRAVHSAADVHQDRASVLLVYADRQRITNHPEVLKDILAELDKLGARAVGCTFTPDEVGYPIQSTYDRENWLYNVRSSQGERTAIPDETGALPTEGEIALLPSPDGIARDHYAVLDTPNGERWSLEGILAAHILVQANEIPRGAFGISFRGGRDSLPFCQDTDLLEKNLVANLVEGKLVLIGFRPDAWSPGVMTPTTHGEQMSRLEYHGHALHSLITNTTLAELPPLASLVLFLTTAVIVYAINRRMDLRWTVGLGSLTMMGMWIVTWLFIYVLRIRIPYASLVTIQLLCLLAICDHRFRLSRATLHRLLAQHRVKSRVLKAPTNFGNSKDPWSDLSDLIYQLFYLNRLVIFDLQPGHQHVIPVKAVNCELDEMAERRRDYRRSPFAEATEAKSPVRVDTKDFRFFRRHRDDETQFLAAAMHQGMLMGFLAIDITTDSLETFQDFESCLQRMSDEVGALLAHWRTAQGEHHRQHWLRYLTEVPEQPLVGELDQTNRAIERRMACLETVFEAAASASAIYDLFGQTLMMNRAMFQIMQDRGTVPAEMTAVELLGSLSGRDWNQCRRILRNVVMEHHTEVVEIPATNQRGTSTLYLRPLATSSKEGRGRGEVIEPFRVQGIHFELMENSEVVHRQENKDRIADRMVETLNEQLEDLRSYISQLSDTRLDPSGRGKIAAVATSEVVSALDMLHDCQTFLSHTQSTNPAARVPVQLPAILDHVCTMYRDKANSRGITLDAAWPDHVDDVLANPQLLSRVFEVITELLLANARNYSCIQMVVEDELSQVRISFENEGFGTTEERLRAALSDQYNNSLDEFRRLKDLRDWIELWNGTMTVKSQLGLGIVINLVLPKYEWGTNSSGLNQSESNESLIATDDSSTNPESNGFALSRS